MSADLLEAYTSSAGSEAVQQVRNLGRHLAGASVVHLNSTRTGGGVAEILATLVPLMRAVGLEVDWEIITGGEGFFGCTKTLHNALQGRTISPSDTMTAAYDEANRECADLLRPRLRDADFVFVHDPQPAGLLAAVPERKGKWIWRCHIDLSRPYRPVWSWLRRRLEGFDASITPIGSLKRSKRETCRTSGSTGSSWYRSRTPRTSSSERSQFFSLRGSMLGGIRYCRCGNGCAKSAREKMLASYGATKSRR